MRRSFPPRREIGASRIVVGVAIIVALMLFVGREVRDGADKGGRLYLHATGSKLLAEIASTPEARARGLAGRAEMSSDALLLQWEDAGPHPIWMKSMRFPLDLLWLDESRAVIAVVPNAPPCGEGECPLLLPAGAERARAVLELRAGDAARLGIRVGVVLR